MNINWIIPTILILGGILLMIYVFRFSRELYYGRNASLSKYLISSVLFGLWVFLILVGVVMELGATDTSYKWVANEILGVILFGFVIGLIATIGALWGYFVIGKFRQLLYEWIKRKYKK